MSAGYVVADVAGMSMPGNYRVTEDRPMRLEDTEGTDELGPTADELNDEIRLHDYVTERDERLARGIRAYRVWLNEEAEKQAPTSYITRWRWSLAQNGGAA